MTSEQRRLQVQHDWVNSPDFKTDIERILDRQDRIAQAKRKSAKTKTTRRPEHDYNVISAYSLKCSHCGVIKDILFDTPKYRNVRGKDRDYEPECIEKS